MHWAVYIGGFILTWFAILIIFAFFDSSTKTTNQDANIVIIMTTILDVGIWLVIYGIYQ